MKLTAAQAKKNDNANFLSFQTSIDSDASMVRRKSRETVCVQWVFFLFKSQKRAKIGQKAPKKPRWPNMSFFAFLNVLLKCSF